MPQNMFPFDIFGFMSGMFVLIFVIAIIFFIIVILIVYKLLHTNVDNVKKKSAKITNIPNESALKATEENAKDKLLEEEIVSICKYCGEKIDENTSFCPFCGSNLAD